jgi:solute carrier family 13 (sodium-dependent dicarboxylate transporter), member 2/3/5
MPQLIARPGPSRPPWYTDVVLPGPPQRGHSSWQAIKPTLPALAAVAGASLLLLTLPNGLDLSGRITLVVFLGAVALWVGSRIDDTFVALGAALALVATGVVGSDVLFATLGADTIWLLIAAFVLAAGVSATGLTARFAACLITRAKSVRQLAHLVTVALLVSAFAVPSTSGRAALSVPVFTALAAALGERRRVVKAFAVLFPTVILLTAIATLIGAGAHLVTNQVLASATGQQIGFAQWLLLGIPLAVLSAHSAAELVIGLFTTRADRKARLRIHVSHLAAAVPTPITGPLTPSEKRALVVLGAVVLGWCTEGLHGAHPALMALAGALAITSPRVGTTTMPAGLRTVPWSLLVFMAATAAVGTALATSGAANWLASGLFGPVLDAPHWAFVAVVIVLSVAAHLVVQSRTARSSVLVPLIVPVAVGLGLNPAAVAFASTAAAGFCHTLTSSAKPVAMFAALDGVPTYGRADLLRLSAWLAPLTAILVLACSLVLWPHLGLPLH